MVSADDEGCHVADWLTSLNRAFRSPRLNATRLDVFALAPGAEFTSYLLRNESKGASSSDDASKYATLLGVMKMAIDTSCKRLFSTLRQATRRSLGTNSDFGQFLQHC